MRKKVFEFTKDKSSKYYFKGLSKEEQKILDKFKDKVNTNASRERSKEGFNEILRFRIITDKHLDEIDIEDLQYYLRELRKSSFSDNFKNKLKGFVHHFLKWKYNDWSERFNGFEDINYNSDTDRIKPITSEDVLTKQEINQILETEKNLYWKTFFIVQYESAGRTGEIRKLKWKDVRFRDDDFTDIKLSSKKNKDGAIKIRELPLKQSTKFLKSLRKQQKAEGIKSDWLFPSPVNSNKHISKSVNSWFNNLTQKAINRKITPYLLRHTRGTELANLVHQGVMAKEIAIKFMGHSEKMFDKVYSHVKDKFVKNEMKKQIYNFEYIPEEKDKIKDLEKQIRLLLRFARGEISYDKKANVFYGKDMKQIESK